MRGEGRDHGRGDGGILISGVGKKAEAEDRERVISVAEIKFTKKVMKSIVSFALLLLPQVYALVATNAAFVRRSVVKYTDQVSGVE